MPAHHNVSFLDGSGKDEITKFPHALQSVGAYRFVPGVEAHIDLVHKGRLKIGDVRSLVDPRGLNLRLRRCDRQRIGVSADFLEGWQNEDLFLGSAFEAILEATGNGSNGSPETGGDQFGRWCVRLGHQHRNVLAHRIVFVKALCQEFGQCLDLVQSKNRSRRVVKPTV